MLPHARYHLLRLSTRSWWSRVPVHSSALPRRSVKSPSVPSELCQARPVPFGSQVHPTKDTSDRRLQSHMSKTSTRCFARLPSRLSRLPSTRSNECCGSRRSHPLRAALPAVQRVFSSRCSAGAPSPLMLPSPPVPSPGLRRATTRATKTTSTTTERDIAAACHGPEHLPLVRSPPRALRWSPHPGFSQALGSSSRHLFAQDGVQPLCTRPRPLASATTEARP